MGRGTQMIVRIVQRRIRTLNVYEPWISQPGSEPVWPCLCDQLASSHLPFGAKNYEIQFEIFLIYYDKKFHD